MSAAAESAVPAALQWAQRDDYHIATTCGRYTVSRVTVSVLSVVHYIAWRRQPKLREIDSVRLPIAAGDEERIAARRQMQQRCAEDFANNSGSQAA